MEVSNIVLDTPQQYTTVVRPFNEVTIYFNAQTYTTVESPTSAHSFGILVSRSGPLLRRIAITGLHTAA